MSSTMNKGLGVLYYKYNITCSGLFLSPRLLLGDNLVGTCLSRRFAMPTCESTIIDAPFILSIVFAFTSRYVYHILILH